MISPMMHYDPHRAPWVRRAMFQQIPIDIRMAILEYLPGMRVRNVADLMLTVGRFIDDHEYLSARAVAIEEI
jgi:hypothetical protein